MLKRYFKKIRLDASGYGGNYCRSTGYEVNRKYYTCLMRILLFFKNIKIGKNASFYNKAVFYRCPESDIRIGNDCTFDSSTSRNAIGVNNRCLVSTLTKQARLSIGNDVGFSGVKICCAENITIGNNCLIGANVVITDNDFHPVNPNKRKEHGFREYCKKKAITIGNNVFIGVNSIVLKGSVIGDNSVIGAGSVVSGIIPPNVVAAGNPCKIIKKLLSCVIILFSLLLTACTNDIEHKIEGQWQLKTLEENGKVSPVDTVFYSFMRKRAFSITILKPYGQVLHTWDSSRDDSDTYYGYIDELVDDKILINIAQDNSDNYEWFKVDVGWNEGQRIFDILNVNSKDLVLRYNEQIYSFKKH